MADFIGLLELRFKTFDMLLQPFSGRVWSGNTLTADQPSRHREDEPHNTNNHQQEHS